MPTIRGKYPSDSLGKDKVAEMPDRDMTPKSYADAVDANSDMSAVIKNVKPTRVTKR